MNEYVGIQPSSSGHLSSQVGEKTEGDVKMLSD